MTADRIKEIQSKTAFPNSVSVCQALLQVWNECEQDNKDKKYTVEDMINIVNKSRETGLTVEYLILSLNKQE
jgi:hypothetical protein